VFPSITDEGRSILRNVVILRHFKSSRQTVDKVKNKEISAKKVASLHRYQGYLSIAYMNTGTYMFVPSLLSEA
jgi:hypothetical protein